MLVSVELAVTSTNSCKIYNIRYLFELLVSELFVCSLVDLDSKQWGGLRTHGVGGLQCKFTVTVSGPYKNDEKSLI